MHWLSFWMGVGMGITILITILAIGSLVAAGIEDRLPGHAIRIPPEFPGYRGDGADLENQPPSQ